MELLRHLAFAGGDWVIAVLAGCSVLAVAVVLDRAALFLREGILSPRQVRRYEAGAGTAPFFARRLEAGRGSDAGAAARIRDRLDLERRLVVLGSLGSLSPFVGLFGTVLGIIRAFRDLAQVGSGHPEIVMQGIAEALIATAMGIVVATVSIACYNFFNRRIKEAFAEAERLELLRGGESARGR